MTDIPPRRCGRRRAFTLVELVMVLVIVGVVSAIAVPRFASATQNHRVAAAAHRLVADLTMAQSRAAMTSESLAVTFWPGTGRYAIPGVADLKSGGNTYLVDLSASPFDAVIVSTTFAGATATGGTSQLRFDGFGAADASGTIIVAARDATRTVTVDPASGKARTP